MYRKFRLPERVKAVKKIGSIAILQPAHTVEFVTRYAIPSRGFNALQSPVMLQSLGWAPRRLEFRREICERDKERAMI